MALTPQQELDKLNTDKTYTGGSTYGRTPGGIINLSTGEKVSGGDVPAPTTPTGQKLVMNEQGQFVTEDQLARSGLRRYSGTGAPSTPTFASEAPKILTPAAPVDEQAIRDKALADVQSQIQASNEVFLTMLAEEKARGAARAGATRAVSARTGVLGQDFGNAAAAETDAFNTEQQNAILAKQEAEKQRILSGAQTRADALIQAEKATADKKNTDYLNYLAGTQTAAKEDLANLAKSGISLDKLKGDEYRKLIEQSGLSELGMNALFIANKPQATKIGEETAGNKKIFFYRNPDGTISQQALDLGFDLTKKKVQINEKTGDIVVYPEQFDPNSTPESQIKVITGKLQPEPVKETPDEKARREITVAEQLVKDNPTASKKDLEAQIRLSFPGLSDGTIESLLVGKSNLTRESLSSMFGIPDNAEKTDYLGYFGKTNKEKLDGIEATIKQYKDAGFSDEAIMKMIKDNQAG